MIIDPDGKVLRLTPSAERLLQRDLKIVKGRIVSWNSDATRALDRALHKLVREGIPSVRPVGVAAASRPPDHRLPFAPGPGSPVVFRARPRPRGASRLLADSSRLISLAGLADVSLPINSAAM